MEYKIISEDGNEWVIHGSADSPIRKEHFGPIIVDDGKEVWTIGPVE